jgi:hypothetical protein
MAFTNPERSLFPFGVLRAVQSEVLPEVTDVSCQEFTANKKAT